MQPKRLKFLGVDYEPHDLAGRVEVKVYQEEAEQSEATLAGVEDPRFLASGDGRHNLGLKEAAGYSLRIEIHADGPENPLTLRGLGLAYYVQESAL